ncbi:hypothetical protein VH564_18725, partial [Rhizobium sp. HT1-10]
LMLLQNADDLFVCKTVALHPLVLSMGQSLLQNGLIRRGKVTVSLRGGLLSQFRTVKASDCLVLPNGLAPRHGASALINPTTALAMVETMRREGHTALVNTAAASALGLMLNRPCQTDEVPWVNVVRSQE